ncbi:MAG: hypothetical protein QXU32_06750 [Nitrososphaerales archaeon]
MIYVSYMFKDKIVKIDGKTNEIVQLIEAGAIPWDIVVDSKTHKIYASMKGNDKIVVMDPKAVATTLQVVTMELPAAVVGLIKAHGQDVLVSDAFVDINNKRIALLLSTIDGGNLMLEIPRMILDAREDGIDSKFQVLIDGNVSQYEDIGADDEFRLISVFIPKNSRGVEIIGTSVIPEFGVIVALILTACIASVITLYRTELIPKI